MSIGAGPNPSLTGEDPEPLGSSDGHTSSGSRSLEHARYEESTCEADNEFHGPASTTTFMKHIREIIEDGTPTNVASVSQLRQSTSHIPLRSPDHMLPPRQLADSLLGHYWEFVHPLYPFLHKPDFDGMYESLCTGREFPNNACKVMRVDKATSLCVLNLVFALGCQYHHESGPEKAEATAEVFYKQARSLLRTDPIETTNNTLQLVQAMLLMTQLLLGTGQTQRAWGIVGMAVRTCYQLGLHHAASSDTDEFPKPMDREIIRAVYHGTLMLER